MRHICRSVSCLDGIKDGDESDVDCGGSCGACADGQHCTRDMDCYTGICAAGLCVEGFCLDGTRDGNESDVDCGGSCALCGTGKRCGRPEDCASGVCNAGTCQ
jgi:hypothetical protein